MPRRNFKIWRGGPDHGEFKTYSADVEEGMVVLDVIHRIQASQAGDLAVRWNCKAGKCGSCSVEINGKPSLACMTRMNSLPQHETITVQPIKAFPIVKDLVTDVSWNYRQNKRIPPFKPKAPGPDGNHRMYQEDVDRVQEFRKCIECYLCQIHVTCSAIGIDRAPLWGRGSWFDWPVWKCIPWTMTIGCRRSKKRLVPGFAISPSVVLMSAQSTSISPITASFL